MKYRIVFLFVIGFFLICCKIEAQRSFYFTGGLEACNTGKYGFQQQGNILQKGWNNNYKVFSTIKYNIGLQYQISRFFMIEFGIQFKKVHLVVTDDYFMKQNNITSISNFGYTSNFNGVATDRGAFDFSKWYIAPYLTGYFILPISYLIKPYIGAGLAPNIYTGSHTTITGTYYYSPTGETLQMTAHYPPFYVSKFLEVGMLEKDDDDDLTIFLGVKYNITNDIEIISSNYTNTRNNQIQYSDHVQVSGNYFSISIQMSKLIFAGKSTSPIKH